jgi:CubicO group peptidase (beta-lactamase class C family)
MTAIAGPDLAARVSALLDAAVIGGVVPGAVVCVIHAGDVVVHAAHGRAALEPEPRPMRLDTVFDLASLTKPLATATLVLQLVEEGALSLDEPVGRFLPELDGAPLGETTARRLLSHSSGVPGWRATYSWGHGGPAILQGLAELDLAYPPGSDSQYSCVGYVLLGLLAERLLGVSLREAFRRRVTDALGLERIGYALELGPGSSRRLSAATRSSRRCSRARASRSPAGALVAIPAT